MIADAHIKEYMSAENVVLYRIQLPRAKQSLGQSEFAQRFQVLMGTSVALLRPNDSRVVRPPTLPPAFGIG